MGPVEYLHLVLPDNCDTGARAFFHFRSQRDEQGFHIRPADRP